ncbi:MAG: ABC transporter ATP-binding protein [Gemmataceae bacterium]|nr:ABC transporter ATP-binding protein [Gemmataceae bacterium]
MDAVLEIDDLAIRYGSHRAVQGLSLRARAGEILGLLGPNGSGKSSTLAAVAGLLRPSSGEVRVGGLAEARSPLAYRRLVGLVPQELAIYDELPAAQNCAFFGRLYGLSGKALAARVEEVLEFVRLSDVAKRPPRTFSGGMQRRLNLACALLHRPALLLLDEPTVGLDIQSREAVFDTLRALAREGTALVFTTHHLEEAEQLCDRACIMDKGKLAASGTMPELLGQQGRRWRLDGPHARGGRLERLFLELTGKGLRDS